MAFVKQVSELKLLHHDQSPPESVIIILFILFQIWQIYQKLLDLIKIVPSFPSQIFPLLWSMMHLFTMIFFIFILMHHSCDTKMQKRWPVDIVCSVASPNIHWCLFISLPICCLLYHLDMQIDFFKKQLYLG